MNCLLLLIILFCCGGNSNGCSRKDTCRNSNGCSRRDTCGSVCKKDNYGVREEYDRCSERKEEHGCNHDNHFSHTPPPMPRTQFPYLDVEPRTCGCEAEENS